MDLGFFFSQSGPTADGAAQVKARLSSSSEFHQPLLVTEKSSQGPTESDGDLRQSEDEDAPFIVTIHGIPPTTTNMYNMMVGGTLRIHACIVLSCGLNAGRVFVVMLKCLYYFFAL